MDESKKTERKKISAIFAAGIFAGILGSVCSLMLSMAVSPAHSDDLGRLGRDFLIGSCAEGHERACWELRGRGYERYWRGGRWYWRGHGWDSFHYMPHGPRRDMPPEAWHHYSDREGPHYNPCAGRPGGCGYYR